MKRKTKSNSIVNPKTGCKVFRHTKLGKKLVIQEFCSSAEHGFANDASFVVFDLLRTWLHSQTNQTQVFGVAATLAAASKYTHRMLTDLMDETEASAYATMQMKRYPYSHLGTAIEHRGDFTSMFSPGHNAVTWYAQFVRSDTLVALFAKMLDHVDPNQRFEGLSPLESAAVTANWKTAKALLTAGATVTEESIIRMLHLGKRDRGERLFWRLIGEAFSGLVSPEVLRIALAQKSYAAATVFLETGTDPTNDPRLVFQVLENGGDVNMLDALLQYGAPADRQNDFLVTPLEYAMIFPPDMSYRLAACGTLLERRHDLVYAHDYIELALTTLRGRFMVQMCAMLVNYCALVKREHLTAAAALHPEYADELFRIFSTVTIV